MARRHHQPPQPAKARQDQQPLVAMIFDIIKQHQVSATALQGTATCCCISLHQGERHLGKTGGKSLDKVGQDIAGLQMGRGDGELSLFRVDMSPRHRLDGCHLLQHVGRDLDHLLTDRGDPGQMLAASLEDLDAKLIFQHPYLLADPGLGGIEALGCRRQIKAVIRHFDDITQLLQLHGAILWRRHH